MTPGRRGPGDDQGQFAHFRLKTDISGLFPYINSMAEAAGYFPSLPFIRFILDGFCCGLHSTHGVAASFAHMQQAVDFMARLVDFLNEVSRSPGNCEPNYRAWNPLPVLKIFQLLPRTNCAACGYASCLAFAAAMSRRQIGPERCPGFRRPMQIQAIYPLTGPQGEMVETVALDLNMDSFGHLRGQVYSGRPHPPNPKKPAAIPNLTNREQEVLRLVVQGATNPEIADRLGISSHTVKSHIIAIFNKLAINDRTQAAVWAVRNNLL